MQSYDLVSRRWLSVVVSSVGAMRRWMCSFVFSVVISAPRMAGDGVETGSGFSSSSSFPFPFCFCLSFSLIFSFSFSSFLVDFCDLLEEGCLSFFDAPEDGGGEDEAVGMREGKKAGAVALMVVEEEAPPLRRCCCLRALSSGVWYVTLSCCGSAIL